MSAAPHTVTTQVVAPGEPSLYGRGELLSESPGSSAPSAHYWRHWWCVVILGVLNNFHYAIVLSSAYSLASAFSALPLIGLIQWATVILAIVAKLVNGLYLLHTRADHRVWASCMACMAGLAVLSLAVSLRVGFWLALLAICVIGGYGAMCESCVLARLPHFPPSMLSAWGVGTGLSGVTGTLTFLLLHGVWGLDERAVYVLISPACLVYIAAFHYIHSAHSLHPTTARARSVRATNGDWSDWQHSEQLPVSSTLADSDTESGVDNGSGGGGGGGLSRPSPLSRAMRVGLYVRWLALQLALVYLFEFVVLVGLASQADPQSDGSGWWYDNAYEVLSFCYQAGVLLSRSSISVVHFNVRQLPWLTLLQFANAVVWTVQAWRGLMPLWLQFAHMLFVGLLGGAMYVNVFQLINSDQQLHGHNRELAINLVTAAYNVGLVGASILEIVLLNTVLTRQR